MRARTWSARRTARITPDWPKSKRPTTPTIYSTSTRTSDPHGRADSQDIRRQEAESGYGNEKARTPIRLLASTGAGYLGADGGIRTLDLVFTKHLLYH